ncbi:MAG: 30S ribosomal protein S7 [Candidatus Margulisbacteria bacterium]|nr:30S ribosomal protein S7 [Candidatus Margulisiibacteriota bacterium]MBU1021032.1 30S ribosomal protein S7 [Candidatus Margulisiibacteriota bacterium]MBU1729707.1 30S ribosomal protein S7 [Candidatus Margulisiibacteriota bacterium]MBU1955972.1 30S ribosomal protein S7 [Candidatus Margulisiibacteriota bacterium]
MPRRGQIKKRKIGPEPKYGSELIHKFINKMMYDGKKSKAEKIVYTAMEQAAAKLKKEPLEVFEKVIKNCSPLMEVKPRRVGGATYQIPVEVDSGRAKALAMQWLRQASRARAGHSMIEKLAAEFMDAYNGGGGAMGSRETTHKMAEANKAFAHFRW